MNLLGLVGPVLVWGVHVVGQEAVATVDVFSGVSLLGLAVAGACVLGVALVLDRIRGRRRENDPLFIELEKVRISLKALEAQLALKDEELDQLHEERRRQESTLEANDAELNSLGKRNGELQKELLLLETTWGTLDELQNDIEDVKECDELRDTIARLRSDLFAKESKLSRGSSERARLRGELDRVASAEAEATATLEERTALSRRLEAVLASTTSALDRVREKVADFEQRCQTSDAQLQRSTLGQREAERKVRSLQSDIAELHAALAARRKSENVLEEALAAVQKELARVREDSASAAGKDAAILAGLKKRCGDFESMEVALDAAQQELACERGKHAAALAEMESYRETSEQTMSTTLVRLDQQSKEVDILRAELESATCEPVPTEVLTLLGSINAQILRAESKAKAHAVTIQLAESPATSSDEMRGYVELSGLLVKRDCTIDQLESDLDARDRDIAKRDAEMTELISMIWDLEDMCARLQEQLFRMQSATADPIGECEGISTASSDFATADSHVSDPRDDDDVSTHSGLVGRDPRSRTAQRDSARLSYEIRQAFTKIQELLSTGSALADSDQRPLSSPGQLLPPADVGQTESEPLQGPIQDDAALRATSQISLRPRDANQSGSEGAMFRRRGLSKLADTNPALQELLERAKDDPSILIQMEPPSRAVPRVPRLNEVALQTIHEERRRRTTRGESTVDLTEVKQLSELTESFFDGTMSVSKLLKKNARLRGVSTPDAGAIACALVEKEQADVRSRVILELIETERSYLEKLVAFHGFFIIPMTRLVQGGGTAAAPDSSPIVSEADLQTVFGNWEEIMALSAAFRTNLEKRVKRYWRDTFSGALQRYDDQGEVQAAPVNLTSPRNRRVVGYAWGATTSPETSRNGENLTEERLVNKRKLALTSLADVLHFLVDAPAMFVSTYGEYTSNYQKGYRMLKKLIHDEEFVNYIVRHIDFGELTGDSELALFGKLKPRKRVGPSAISSRGGPGSLSLGSHRGTSTRAPTGPKSHSAVATPARERSISAKKRTIARLKSLTGDQQAEHDNTSASDEIVAHNIFVLLSTFLVLPIQRLPRYLLLMRELLKNTAEDHPDAGELAKIVALFEATLESIEHQTRRHTISEALKWHISNSAELSEGGIDFQQFRNEGWFTYKKKTRVALLLFDAYLLVVQPRKEKGSKRKLGKVEAHEPALLSAEDSTVSRAYGSMEALFFIRLPLLQVSDMTSNSFTLGSKSKAEIAKSCRVTGDPNSVGRWVVMLRQATFDCIARVKQRVV